MGFAIWTDVGKCRFWQLAEEHREPFRHVAHIRRAKLWETRRAEMRRRRGL